MRMSVLLSTFEGPDNTIINRNTLCLYGVRDVKYVRCERVSSVVGEGATAVNFNTNDALLLSSKFVC